MKRGGDATELLRSGSRHADDACGVRRTLSDHDDREGAGSAVRSFKPRPARRLGRYVLLDLLGRGGMGEVYRAFDPGLDRMVAIKRLRSSEPMSDRARSRLVREAQVAARLCHPHVVQVFDVGVDEASQDAYIVMELVQGETLRDWLRPGRPWREVLEQFVLVGRGLHAAHIRGVVHRDFKPENVLLGEQGEPKVVDFGLAKPAQDARISRNSGELERLSASEIEACRRATDEDMPILSGPNALTPAGSRLGTPAYMPPEQMRSEPSDPRSDQYAFAVSLYEALTSRLPFAGTNARRYAMAVLDGAVRPFPNRSPVPRRVQRAVLRALSYNADHRFTSLEPLLSELEAANGRPWTGRGPLLSAAAVGLGVGVAVTVWLTTL